jgi:hypothetical protein
MSIRYSSFKNAEAQLQAAFQAKFPNQSVHIEEISGTDIYYTDGDAQRFMGKFVLVDANGSKSGMAFFTESGPAYSFPKAYAKCFQDWIDSIRSSGGS